MPINDDQHRDPSPRRDVDENIPCPGFRFCNKQVNGQGKKDLKPIVIIDSIVDLDLRKISLNRFD